MKDPPARDLSEVQRVREPRDLRAEPQPIQLLESDRGRSTRRSARKKRSSRKRKLQKVYERIWLPPPVKHSPWE